MTFLPSWIRVFRSPLVMSGLFSLAGLLTLSACSESHVGRPCSIGTANVDATKTTFNTPALECPSRVCLLPANLGSEKVTGALCTAECSSDDDCSDGEKRGSGADDKRCKLGFSCRAILPPLSTNNLACKPVCVCKDFLADPTEPAKKPEGC